MMPAIIIRPQPGCDATVAAARAAGLDARGFPLFAVTPVAWQPPPADTVDAVLLGSANAIRHAGSGLAVLRGKPAYAVGQTTATAARNAGLNVIDTGEGGLQPVLSRVRPEHRRLLRLAGRERIVLTPPAGVEMAECVVYASEPQPMPDELATLLHAGPALVLLHSAEAARHFAASSDARGIARGTIALAVIGPRVAQAAGEGWARLECAPRPGDAALLALAARMCQERPTT